MKIIIDIPEEAHNTLLTEQCIPNGLDLEYLVMHGTLLPKGHGKIIDVDALLSNIETKAFLSQDNMHLVTIGKVKEAIDTAPIIVKPER